MNTPKVHYLNKPIKITQATLQYGLQSWLETIYLINDKESSRLSDWTVGFYHCKHCNAYQGFAHQITDTPSAKAHNERLEFMSKHAHGDGRIMLFDTRMPE